jgi:hypothetical protein
MAMLALALAFGLAFVSCDNGTADDDESFDANKLIGRWINDVEENRFFEFSNLNIGPEYCTFRLIYGTSDQNYRILTSAYLDGDVMGFGDDTCKVAFEGEKLKISESQGRFNGFDGLYTKQ